MKTAMTIRLDGDLAQRISDLARRSGRTRSEIVREALRRQLSIQTFDRLQEQIIPLATAAGYHTEADLFREIS
jgi:predicted transcriptional regulator